MNNTNINYDNYFSNATKIVESTKKYNDLYAKLFKSLNSDFINSIEKSKINDFLSNLVLFLKSDTLLLSEKKLFLNGSEIFLIKMALDISDIESAKYINTLRPNRSLSVFKSYIYECAREGKTNKILQLIDLCSDIHFDEDLLLRIIFVAGVRNVEFYNTLTNKYGYSINKVGKLFESEAIGSVSQIMIASPLANNFFNDFVSQFHNTIDLSNPYISKSGQKINSLNLLFLNKSIDVSEKISRIDFLMNNNIIKESELSDILNFLFDYEILSSNWKTQIYTTLFTYGIFNSTQKFRDMVFELCVKSSFSNKYLEDRSQLSKTVNPLIAILQTMLNASSQLFHTDTVKPINYWIELSKSSAYNLELLSYFRSIDTGLDVSKIITNNINPDIMLALDINKTEKGKGIKFIVEAVTSNIKQIAVTKSIKTKVSTLLDSESSVPLIVKSVFSQSIIDKIKEKNILNILESIMDIHSQYLVLMEQSKSLESNKYVSITIPEKCNLICQKFLLNQNNGTIKEQFTTLNECLSSLKALESELFDLLDSLVLEL